MTTPPALIVQNLRRVYGSGPSAVHALDDVSLSVAPGEFVGVIGASGSGKSTLLHCAAGLEEPSSGAVVFGGADVARLSRTQRARHRARHVGFVFQDYNLVSSLTAFDNVALPARIAGHPLATQAVSDALTAVGLADHLQKYPHQMSSGERQRVAIARVMAQQPQLVFADEPTAALDIASAETVLTWLRLITQTGTAVVMVSHDLTAASRTDRVIALSHGHVIAEQRHPRPEILTQLLLPHEQAVSVRA